MPKNQYFDTFLHETSYSLMLECSLALVLKIFSAKIQWYDRVEGSKKPLFDPI